MSNQALKALNAQIEEARKADILFDVKCDIHQKLMDYYFKDQNPMLLDREQPEKAKELFSKVGKHMEQIFGKGA